MFAGGFDFSFPAVNRFDRCGVDVDAGGEVFLEEGTGELAGFQEGGAGYEDEAELGGGHGFLKDIVVDLRREESLTQRRGGRREDQIEEQIRKVVALDRKNPPFAKDAKDGAPSSSGGPGLTTDTRVTVECGDYGYYTDCFAH